MTENLDQNHPERESSASLESTLLMIGGLLIVFLGQYLAQLSPHKLITTTLLVVGACAFLIGVLASNSTAIAAMLQQSLGKPASRLGVSKTQVLLLVFGFSLSLASRAAAGNSLQAHSPWHVLIWIAGCLVVIAGCWRGSLKESLRGIDRWDWVLIGVLAAIALAARLIQLDQLPYTVSGDEGSVGLMAWDYKTGVRNNYFIMGWFSFPALQFWPASLMQEIFGRSVLAMRIPSAIGGALSVLAVYWSARLMFGRLTGVIAALFLAFFHYHLLFSRIALTNVWDGFFLMLMIASLWSAWQENRRLAFLSAGLAIGLGQFFYTTAHLLPAYALLWLLILYKSLPKTGRLPGIACTILVTAVVVLPLALFYFQNPNELSAPLNRVSILKGDWIRDTSLTTGDSVFMIFAKQFWQTVRGFTASPILGVYSPGRPMLLPLPATLFIAGLILTLLRIKQPQYNILLIALIGPVLASTFSVGPPNAQRLLLAAPIVAIVIALPLQEIHQQINAARTQYHSIYAAAAIVFMLLIGYFEVRFFQQAMAEGRYSDSKSRIAREIGETLRQQGKDLAVYFLGQPVMDYNTLPCLPYIADNATGHDMSWPIDWTQYPELGGSPAAFVILAQNAEALPEIEGKFPLGTTIVGRDESGQPTYYIRLLQTSPDN
jgi:4-amino-4-deoxy-L-arabinose transferase-like glycosyltransferase